jgi:O-antigen ligase
MLAMRDYKLASFQKFFLPAALLGFLILIAMNLMAVKKINGSSMDFILIFVFSGFLLGFLRPRLLLILFYLLLPLSGLLTRLNELAVFSPLIIYLESGALGLLSKNLWKPNRLSFFLPKPILFVFLGIIISAGCAIISFVPALLSGSGVVAVLPWGEIKIGNAIGWVFFNFNLWLCGLLLFYFHLQVKNLASENENILGYLLWGMIPSLAIFFLQLFIGDHSLKKSGGFYDHNSLGLSLALLLPILFGNILDGKKNSRIVLCPLYLLVIILSGSRSALLIAIGSLIAMFGCCLFYRRKLIMVLLFLCISILPILSYLSFAGFRQSRSIWFFLNLERNYQSAQNKNKHSQDKIKNNMTVIFGDRIGLWKAGWVTFRHNPVLGVGLGTYLFRMPAYAEEIGSVVNDNACNMYLQVLAEQGLIGFLIFTYLIVSIIGLIFKSDLGSREFLIWGASVSFLSLLVAFLFGSHLLNFESHIIFWVLISILYVNIVKKPLEKTSEGL